MIAEKNEKPFSSFLYELGLERSDLKVLLFYSLAVGLFSLTVPIGVQSLVNSVAFSTVMQPVFVLSLLVFIGISLSGLFRVIQRWIAEYLVLRVAVRLTHRLVDRLIEADENLNTDSTNASRLNRFLEVFEVQKSLIFLIIDGLESCLILSLGLILMAFYHPFLFVFAVLLVASIAFVVRFTYSRGTRYALAESTEKYELASWIVQLAGASRDFKSYLNAEYAKDLVNERLQAYLVSRKKFFVLLITQLASGWVIYVISSTLLLALGGVLVFKSQLSLGQLVAAELVLAGVLSALLKLIKVFEAYFDSYASMHKIDELLAIDCESKPAVGATLDTSSGFRIDIEGLLYSSRGAQPIFDGLNVVCKSGSLNVVVGPSGSGKTTLVEMIYGLYPPTGGKILVNGIDFKHIDRMKFRDSVAWVTRFDSFGGTIRQNLLRGRDIPTAEVIEVLKACLVWDAVSSFEQGLDTQMPRGVPLPLSEGQLAKLSIARAILQKPSLVLVDEVLDSIDLRKRAVVLRALRHLLPRATLVISTHDLECFTNADQIVDLAMEAKS